MDTSATGVDYEHDVSFVVDFAVNRAHFALIDARWQAERRRMEKIPVACLCHHVACNCQSLLGFAIIWMRNAFGVTFRKCSCMNGVHRCLPS